MLSTTLFPPLFPQMENDGVINQAELNSAGIVIDVAEYPNAKQGDLIELWFESYVIDSMGLAEAPVSQYFPWQCNITADVASKFSDGVYKVQYNVIDAAQNSSWSNIGSAILDKTSTGTLPPPLFPEAGSDNTLNYAEAMSGGGTPVTIPNYPNIAVGDNVTLYWVGLKDNEVVQRSITKVAHTVQEDELNGFDILIATAWIIPGELDSARAWYVVKHTDIRNERSENGVVNIDTSSGVVLPAPEFIEGDDGWIDAEEATNGSGTPVNIPAYPGIGVGDAVTLHWQGYDRNDIPVDDAKYEALTVVDTADIAAGFQTIIPTDNIAPVGIGYAISYYDVIFADASVGSSLAAQIGIDVIHTDELPPPQLPEALDDNVIDDTDAMSEGGTPVVVAYDSMAAGDSVTVYWSGYQGDDVTPVSGTVYSITSSVSVAEAEAQSLTAIVPSKYIVPIGKGYAIANYSVQFIAGGIAWSDNTAVTINTAGGEINGSSYLGGSTGFAPWDNTAIQNCYVEYVAMENGVPLRNVDIIFTLFNNNYFTSNHTNSITLPTDIHGIARTNISGSDTTTTTISAQIVQSARPASTLSLETERTSEQIVPYLTSEPYLPGSGNRKFLLSLSQGSGIFKLATNNNSDIYIDGINKGGTVEKITVYSGSPLHFEVTSNNLNNTAVTVSQVAPGTQEYCTFYF